MGWSKGEDSEGRAIGYSVQATCDAPGCEHKIDRGVHHACGGYHDSNANDGTCAGYFCSMHTFTHYCAAEHKILHSPADEQNATYNMKNELMQRWQARVEAEGLDSSPVSANAKVAGWVIDIVVDALGLRNTVPTSHYTPKDTDDG